MKSTATLLILIFASVVLKAQNSETNEREIISHRLKIGISHKVGMGEVLPSEFGARGDLLSFPGVETALLYTDEEKNMLGPSLDLGAELIINPTNTSLEYRMGIRYDHVNRSVDLGSNIVESNNDLFYEHHFLVNQYFGRKRFQPYATAGISLLNRGASYEILVSDGELNEFELHTSAFNLGFGFRVDRLNASFRNYFISGDNNPFNVISNRMLTKSFSVQEVSLHYNF